MTRINCTALPAGLVRTTSPDGFEWICTGAEEPRILMSVEGRSFGGTFKDAAAWMTEQAASTRAWIVMLTGGTGAEAFLDSLDPTVVAVPVVGGASSRPDGNPGWTSPAADEVAVLAIQEGAWSADTLRLHEPIGKPLACISANRRCITAFQTPAGPQPAQEVLRDLRVEHGLSAEDWDGVALLTEAGELIHLHPADDGVLCGRDLPENGRVQPAVFKQPEARARWMDAVDQNSIAFGCAGLYGMFSEDRPWEAAMPTTYLYGEVAMMGGRPRFTNLTVSLLRRTA